MPKAVLECIEDVVGKLSIKKALSVAEMNDKKARSIALELYLHCKAEASVPQRRSPGHLRPYSSHYSQMSETISGPFDFGEELTPQNLEQFIRKLVRKLLLCETVAIDDPVTPGLASKFTRTFSDHLLIVATLRPLISEGALILVPKYGPVSPAQAATQKTAQFDRLNELVRAVDPDPYRESHMPITPYDLGVFTDFSSAPILPRSATGDELDVVQTENFRHIVQGTSFPERLALMRALQGIAVDVRTSARQALGLDILLTSRSRQIAMVELSAHQARQVAPRRPLDVERLTTISSLPNFALDALSVPEVIRLRQQEVVFAEFRRALAGALDRVAAEYSRSDTESSVGQARIDQILAEAIEPSAERLRAAAPNLELSLGVSSVQQVIYGAIPVGVGIASQSPVAGFAAAGAVGALNLHWGYGTSLSRRQPRRLGKRMTDLLANPDE